MLGGFENNNREVLVVKYPKRSSKLEDVNNVLRAILVSSAANLEPGSDLVQGDFKKIAFTKSPVKEKYIQTIHALLNHIQKGDIYEINYCVEFVAENVILDPLYAFQELKKLSDAPYNFLCKHNATYILCVSPERFLKRQGTKLITQPMKGTAKRSDSVREDEQLKNGLLNSEKDKTENVMAVDVARNDLSRVAEKGTVVTSELFTVNSFKSVHQMISTVSCSIHADLSIEEVIKATFPPASMTGAPKIKAMELINKYEDFDREYYSGVVGIKEANGDFDLAVIIRSIFYDEEKKRLSFAVGSAITAQSNPEEEWEECLLKARSILTLLNAT